MKKAQRHNGVHLIPAALSPKSSDGRSWWRGGMACLLGEQSMVAGLSSQGEQSPLLTFHSFSFVHSTFRLQFPLCCQRCWPSDMYSQRWTANFMLNKCESDKQSSKNVPFPRNWASGIPWPPAKRQIFSQEESENTVLLDCSKSWLKQMFHLIYLYRLYSLQSEQDQCFVKDSHWIHDGILIFTNLSNFPPFSLASHQIMLRPIANYCNQSVTFQVSPPVESHTKLFAGIFAFPYCRTKREISPKLNRLVSENQATHLLQSFLFSGSQSEWHSCENRLEICMYMISIARHRSYKISDKFQDLSRI